MDASKNIFVVIWALLMAYIEPVIGSIHVLLLFFAGNLVIGTVCGLYGKGERFSLRKSLTAFLFLAIYVVIITSLHYTGREMGDSHTFSYIIKVITYSFIYFYARNICNCLCVLFPSNRSFKLLKWLLEVKFIAKIPFLSEFLQETDNIRNVSAKSRGKKPRITTESQPNHNV